jgi:hypothetical protein
MGQNSAHIIANWFGGSGYKRSLNLITTSENFNREMTKAEIEIADWVKENDIKTFDLTVDVDWGVESDSKIVSQIIDEIKTTNDINSQSSEKLKRRLLSELVSFAPKLKAVEDVSYRASGKISNSQLIKMAPIATGKDKWL